MKINDGVDEFGIRLCILELDPLPQCADIVAKMWYPRGLNAREDDSWCLANSGCGALHLIETSLALKEIVARCVSLGFCQSVTPGTAVKALWTWEAVRQAGTTRLYAKNGDLC
jgi:hypothetical protein